MSGRRLAVLVSGGGRSLENLAEVIARGELAAELALVVSDRDGIGALERAARLDVPQRVVPWSKGLGVAAFSEQVFEAVEAADCDLVVLAGFLRLLAIPPAWNGRVLNVHPSLLPAFGGKGFWGHHVHEAVVARGVEFTGCTVHFVDDRYDEGPIILQRVVRVAPTDDPDAVAAKVFEEEKRALPEAIRRVLDGTSTPNAPRPARGE